MADKEIADLTEAATLVGTELLHVVQGGNSRKVALSRVIFETKRPYDLRVGFIETPTAAQVIDLIVTGREISLPANFAGSVGNTGVNPSASFVLDVRDDGVSIGTITVSTAGALTFATAGGTAKTVAAGSVITVVAPASVDATIENLNITLLGTT